jgi:hypothetical protein
MKVSIVILCYNEKDTIEKIVEAVCNARLKSREKLAADHNAMYSFTCNDVLHRWGGDDRSRQRSVQINRINTTENDSRLSA